MIKENIESVCFVSKVTEINAIEGADKIEQIKLGDWSCISSKGTHKINDLVVACTHDAVIPLELSEKMEVTNYLRKQRVKTIKLKGVYSECLLINIKQVIELVPSIDIHILREGADLEKTLGIYKYQEPEKEVLNQAGKKVKYSENPRFCVFTKFPNIKNVGNIFNDDELVQVQSKKHGTNFRFGIVPRIKFGFWEKVKKFFGFSVETHEFVFGSHHVNIAYRNNYVGFYKTNVYQEIVEKHNLASIAWDIFIDLELSGTNESLVFYGEIFGPGIQKNYDYGLKEIDFEVFDIRVNEVYSDIDHTKGLIQSNNLKFAEVLEESIKFGDFIKNQEKYVNRFIPGTKIPEEGIVVKPLIQQGSGLRAVKVINPAYLDYSAKHDVTENH